MGVFDKIKNLFSEEVEEEVVNEPIRKEVIQVEIPSPIAKKEVVKEPIVEEKKEEIKKPTGPVFFDDHDFDILDKQVTKTREEINKLAHAKPYTGGTVMKEEKKLFKPTPIISPIYGVLDKNYRKEDITEKDYKKIEENFHLDDSIDSIRKKAYGSLVDDLENTLFGRNKLIFDDIKDEKESIDIFKDIEDEDTKELISNIDAPIKRIEKTIEIEFDNDDIIEDSDYDNLADTKKIIINDYNDLQGDYSTDNEMTIKDDYSSDDEMTTKDDFSNKEEINQDDLFKDTPNESSVNDSELFNLIDSMYERKEDE